MRAFRYSVVMARRHQHAVSFVLAFLLSLVAWYFINVQDYLETQLEVNFMYTGTPPNLVVTDGLAHKATLRLRGPGALIRAIQNERPMNTISLAGIKRGETVIPLVPEDIPRVYRAFDVVDLQPRQITVKAENLLERSVPVQATLNSPLQGNALTVDNVKVSPETVILRGPESVLRTIQRIQVPLAIDPSVTGEVTRSDVALTPPPLVTASPQTVDVSYTITSERTTVSHKCRVTLAAGNAREYDIAPGEVTLVLDVPDALSRNSKYLNQIRVIVMPPDLAPGESGMAKTDILLPEGMTLLGADMDEVRVTHRKKQPTKD